MQGAIVLDPPLAFFRYFSADRLGSSFARNEPSPAMVSAVEFGGAGFTNTVRLAASALGSRKRAGKNRTLRSNGDRGSGSVFLS